MGSAITNPIPINKRDKEVVIKNPFINKGMMTDAAAIKKQYRYTSSLTFWLSPIFYRPYYELSDSTSNG